MFLTKLFKILLVIVTVFSLLSTGVFAQGTLEDYQRAEKFIYKNVEKLIFRTQVKPNWIEEGSCFWYKVKTRRGKEFFLVNPVKRTKKPAFDHRKLAQSISKYLGETYDPFSLPFDIIKYTKKGKVISFSIKNQSFQCNLKNYKCKKIDEKDKGYYVSTSPDGKWEAFTKDYNLYVRSIQTGEEIQLTTDGSKEKSYGNGSWYSLMNESKPGDNHKRIYVRVRWSPDSSKLVTQRVDLTQAKKLYLYQFMPDEGFRAQVFSYYRDLAGEKAGILFEYFIFDIASKKQIPIKIEPLALMQTYDLPHWLNDSQRLYIYYFTRGLKEVFLNEVDAATGNCRLIVQESSPTYVDDDKLYFHILEESKELVWTSERDGWNHLYLYDLQTGKVKNQITSGEYVVYKLGHVDEKKRQVFFLACGREPEADPYFLHLYRVNLNGTGLTRLTSENAYHWIYLSPDKKFFVDRYSRVDLPTVNVLRRLSDGKIILNLEQADIKDLLAIGWTPPESFKVKARDGETDIYGTIFRPSNFDPNKKYPIIDSSYTGPHYVQAPKSFRMGCLNIEQSIAELGFIVVNIDGLGSANRSKAFHDFSYKNLGDIGAPDHMKAMKELAEKYSYIDITRVGIFGWSAGGYDTVRALLMYPDFYKVGVAKSGNHDHRIAKAWWPEIYQGYPVGEHYDKQSNFNHAKNLKGKLLLIHGELDSNVNPTSTLRMAGELIKANKDFELLIIPNGQHDIRFHPYVLRKEWDFFVRHLLGVTPPEYTITTKTQ